MCTGHKKCFFFSLFIETFFSPIICSEIWAETHGDHMWSGRWTCALMSNFMKIWGPILDSMRSDEWISVLSEFDRASAGLQTRWRRALKAGSRVYSITLYFSAKFPYFVKNKRTLMRSPCCLYVFFRYFVARIEWGGGGGERRRVTCQPTRGFSTSLLSHGL
jgi:hypothetical protein